MLLVENRNLQCFFFLLYILKAPPQTKLNNTDSVWEPEAAGIGGWEQPREENNILKGALEIFIGLCSNLWVNTKVCMYSDETPCSKAKNYQGSVNWTLSRTHLWLGDIGFLSSQNGETLLKPWDIQEVPR